MDILGYTTDNKNWPSPLSSKVGLLGCIEVPLQRSTFCMQTLSYLEMVFRFLGINSNLNTVLQKQSRNGILKNMNFMDLMVN